MAMVVENLMKGGMSREARGQRGPSFAPAPALVVLGASSTENRSFCPSSALFYSRAGLQGVGVGAEGTRHKELPCPCATFLPTCCTAFPASPYPPAPAFITCSRLHCPLSPPGPLSAWGPPHSWVCTALGKKATLGLCSLPHALGGEFFLDSIFPQNLAWWGGPCLWIPAHPEENGMVPDHGM